MKWTFGVVSLWVACNAFGYTSTPTENAFRAYPPSCLSDPLPTGPTEGTYSSNRIVLPTSPGTGSETVTLNLWRVACAGGRSAFMGAIIRDTANALTIPTPDFPAFEIAQGSETIPIVRVADEPNTVRSFITVGFPVIGTVTPFVFENHREAPFGPIDYNQAFNISVFAGSTPILAGLISAYDPTQYPSNSEPMPITGYNSGGYYDSTHGGEGMLVEVIDTGATSRVFFAAWYTFDSLGLPFWLTAQGAFTAGATQLSVPGYFTTGGGLGGNFTPPTSLNQWGTLSFNFSDCNTMNFTYSGATIGVASGPAGSGSRTWKRIGVINGFSCD